MKKHYMIIDIGTGNSRVALVASDGTILSIKTIENLYYMDQYYEDAQSFSPSFWKQQILNLCKATIQEHPAITIDAISSSAARETIILIDKDGQDFFGLPNIDNRGKAWVHEIPNKEMIYQKTGRWVSEDFPAMKLYGLRKARKDVFDRVYSFTSLSEWMSYIFTDKLVIEPSQACETQLYDIEKKEWSLQLLSCYQLEHIALPELVKGGEQIGNISEQIKKVLQITYDIPFIIGGGDTQVAAIGAGIKLHDIGIISGTTSPIITLQERYFYDKQQRCWVDSFIGGDVYQVETNPGVTGLNYQRIRSVLFPDVSYDDLEAALQEVTDIKCIASFSSLDFEHGKGFSSGGFFMRPPFHPHLHRIDMAWAVVADIACYIYEQYQNLKQITKVEESYLLGCGGGFQSKMLCQHIANLTNKELRLPQGFQQSSVLGCLALCNQHFNIQRTKKQMECKVFTPVSSSLIHQYCETWKDYRKKINQ